MIHCIYPGLQCRESASTYKAKLQVIVQWKVDNQPQGSLTKVIANIPLMVKVRNSQPLLTRVEANLFACKQL